MQQLLRLLLPLWVPALYQRYRPAQHSPVSGDHTCGQRICRRGRGRRQLKTRWWAERAGMLSGFEPTAKPEAGACQLLRTFCEGKPAIVDGEQGHKYAIEAQDERDIEQHQDEVHPYR